MELKVKVSQDNFDIKYELYSKMIFRICYSYLYNTSDAEDVLQEVFLKYYLTNKTYNSLSDEKYWLIRVAINMCKNFLKQSWKKKVIVDDEYLSNIPVNLPKNTNDFLFDLIYQLPDKYKNVIILFYYEDLSVKEIAKALNISDSAVGKRLERARLMLKKKMEGQNENR